MPNKKCNTSGRPRRPVLAFLLPTAYCLLLTVSCLLLAVFVVSCGRRGDPVLTDPYEESDAAEQSGMRENGASNPDVSGTTEDALTVMQPQSPQGLAAVFTGQKIILVWDEVAGQGVKSYRIYRSAGDVFSLTGEVVAPVFNDRDIEAGARYIYKVSAIGQIESNWSDSVEVVAGGD